MGEQDERVAVTKSAETLTEQERSLLFEQYKLGVEMAEKLNDRRNQANSFFLTVNGVLLTLLTSLPAFIASHQQSWLILAATAGLIICYTWRRLILAHRQMSISKYAVIHELETYLPARLFRAEWALLDHGHVSGYRPFSLEESRIPIIFMILYGLLIFALWTQ